MGLFTRAVLVVFLLFALLFAVLMVLGTYYNIELYLILILAGVIVIAQWAISPFFMDLMLRWIYKFRWTSASDVSEGLDDFITRTCEENGFKPPRFGLIEDDNPNAFCYGRLRSDARMVITTGILKYLSREEQEAVVAHELGHIKHYDFAVMTLATAVPIALYVIARSTLFARGDRGSERGSEYLVLIAAVSFLVYFLSQYIVLFLSRIREYYADQFGGSATRNPNLLSTALVKIAYGMVREPDQKGDKRAQTGQRGIRALGVFDPRVANGLAFSVVGQGLALGEDSVSEAAVWDLKSPWAKFLELQSTHPLPAKRIRALGELAGTYGHAPRYRLDVEPGESLWDEFFVDLAVEYGWIPIALLIGATIWWGLAYGTLSQPLLPLSLGLLGIYWLLRTRFKYRPGHRERKIRDLVRKEFKASPVRGIPCILEGEVVGRGVPGLIFSEDFCLDDGSGMMVQPQNL